MHAAVYMTASSRKSAKFRPTTSTMEPPIGWRCMSLTRLTSNNDRRVMLVSEHKDWTTDH